jgi:hypothetical protein
MVFTPSPALHRIRRLVRLIRKHPDLSGPKKRGALLSQNLHCPDLPDPAQFVDTTVINRDPDGTRMERTARRNRKTCSGSARR